MVRGHLIYQMLGFKFGRTSFDHYISNASFLLHSIENCASFGNLGIISFPRVHPFLVLLIIRLTDLLTVSAHTDVLGEIYFGQLLIILCDIFGFVFRHET